MGISATWLDKVKWSEVGLAPVITQEVGSNDVLMFAWMNRDALTRTIQTGEAVYWSRSRRKLWRKGEESGHFQKIHEIRLDCDADVLLLRVEQVAGIACHTGRHSCFFQKFEGNAESGEWRTVEPVLKTPDAAPENEKPEHTRKTTPTVSFMSETLRRLAKVIESRKPVNGGNPDKSYVAGLFSRGDDAILKKIGEEAAETIMAAKDARVSGDVSELLYECADLWFHSMVMLAQFGLKPQDVLDELARREGLSGLEERAGRPPGA